MSLSYDRVNKMRHRSCHKINELHLRSWYHTTWNRNI